MSEHKYKPDEPVEVRWSNCEWVHEGRTYIGEWMGHVVYGRPGYGTNSAHPDRVRPYTPPVEIPEGWTLIRDDELEAGVHEVYDPDNPDSPLPYPAIYSVLVVARRRADA